MQIIPVIDILNGIVVHAKKGDRKNYQAIQSLLAHSSKPLDIAAALLEYYPFQQLYIADLNSIQKPGGDKSNAQVMESIARQYPHLEIWIDAGISNLTDLDFWHRRNFNVILASENFSNLENFLAVKKQLDSNFVLSLDFMPDGYQGPPELLDSTRHWPKDVILMSLAHVGTSQGINLELLERFKPQAGSFNIYAAGGVKDINDLITLKRTGIHGALIASALHKKQLTPAEIQQVFNT